MKLIEDQRRRLRSALIGSGKDGERTNSTLLDALARFNGMRASDPRDRVYALLGIVTEDHGIVADYSLTVEQVYQDATTALINLSKNLDIICQNPCEPRQGHRALQQHSDSDPAGEHGPSGCLASWAAEFDVGPWDAYSVLFAQRDIFNAGTRTCNTPCRFADPEKRIIVLRGIVLDKVGPILQDKTQNEKPRDVLHMYLGQDITSPQSHRQYDPKTQNGAPLCKEPESALRAFWRTLARDCTAPPGMRRLSKTEIEWLDVGNQLWLAGTQDEAEELQTYCVGVDGGGGHGAGHHPTDKWKYTRARRLEKDAQPPTQSAQGGIEKRLVSIESGEMHWTSHFTVSKNGLFMLVRKHVREGDVIAVLDGAKVPVILRRSENQAASEVGETLLVVGPAYVHGLMDGEVEELVQRGELTKRDLYFA